MKKMLLCVATALVSTVAFCQISNPGWLRKSCISPDGKNIAFAYQGDIFRVSADGGFATAVTTNPAYDSDPVWSEDGQSIFFVSDREKSNDIWVVDALGGAPRRITSYPGNEKLLCVSGGFVYFAANIQPDPKCGDFQGQTISQLYKVPVNGGRPEMIVNLKMNGASVNADGNIVFEQYMGYEDDLRKHHTSAVTRDIWYYVPSTGKFTKLSTFKGEDRNPVFASDGDKFYYLSEQSGTLNVWASSVSKPEQARQISNFGVHPVRNISVAKDNTILFSFNGDLYTCKEGSQPKKLEISIARDVNERDKVIRDVTSGFTDLAVSSNDKEIAVVVHGDVYTSSVEFGTSRRITNTAEQERSVSFDPDGKTLYYASERDGEWGIYRTTLTNSKDKCFTYACDFKEERFSAKGETCFQPVVSPDGKWVAYLRDRTELVIQSTKGGKAKSLLKGANYSYSDGDLSFAWSPDSRYILSTYMGEGRWISTDVVMIDIASGKITDLTNSGYSDGNFKWALGGKAMTWETDKYGYRSHGSWGSEGDIYIMFFDAKAMADFDLDKEGEEIAKLMDPKADKKDSSKVEKFDPNLENLEDRIVRLTPFAGRLGDHFLSPDGKKLYYTARLQKTYDLCVRDLQEGSVKVLSKNVRGEFFPDKSGKHIFYGNSSGIHKLTLSSGDTESVSFSGEFEYKAAGERKYIFEHAWKQVNEKFYDANIHGLDWKAMHDNYAKFLPYITTNEDFCEMLSEMLGELNGSHTGARYYKRSGLKLGHLGVLYDNDYNGKGLKIKEVLPESPLETVAPGLKPGDVIVSVDGKEISAGECWYDVLKNTAGKRIRLELKKGGKVETVFVTPDYSDEYSLYRRWVRQREDMVEKLSGGKVGYVHVESMDSDSFREVYSKALGKYLNCEALIVDIRHNGGGWLHDDLALFLSGKVYSELRPRGQFISNEPFTRWTKKSCVLMSEDCYSDACGFPFVYRSMGLGKLIGMPVPGTMTAVWWERQIDPSIVFGIPQVTNWSVKDKRPIENMQIEPDIYVQNDPESLLRGEDKQLEAAVREMLAK